MQAWQPAIVVTDLKMPRMNGMELLGHIAEMPVQVCVVMLTAQGSIESAVEAMRMGRVGLPAQAGRAGAAEGHSAECEPAAGG